MINVYKKVDVSGGGSLIGVIDDQALIEFAKEWDMEIIDYYQDEEYGEAMQSLENLLLAGDMGVNYD